MELETEESINRSPESVGELSLLCGSMSGRYVCMCAIIHLAFSFFLSLSLLDKALAQVEKLAQMLEVAKSNFRHLGGVLDEDVKFKEIQRKHGQ